MTAVTLRCFLSLVVFHSCTIPVTNAILRVDVSTTVEQKIGSPATVDCNIQNFNAATQYLAWMFLDAEVIQNKLVSSETIVQGSYRDRFSVSIATRMTRVRYRLSVTNLRKEDDGTYRCQVMDRFSNTMVRYGLVSVSVMYFPNPPSCTPEGEFHIMENSRLTMSCRSESGNPTVDMRITREVAGLPVGPLITAVGMRPANWSYYENDDQITRELTVSISSKYTASSFPCTIIAPGPTGRVDFCTIGPIIAIPVARVAKIYVTVEPTRVLTVSVGSSAMLTCVVTVTPHVDSARVQKSWSTVPFIEPERMVIPDRSFADSVWIKAIDVDDDGMIVTCTTVIRGVVKKASSTIRVVPTTLPPPITTFAPRNIEPTAPRATEAPQPTTLKSVSIRIVTRQDISEPVDIDITNKPEERNVLHSTSLALTTVVQPSDPTVPAIPAQTWLSKPTGIAFVILITIFIFASLVVVGVAYTRRFSRKRLRKRISHNFPNPQYQNIWSTKYSTMPRGTSKRSQVISSVHIYHEAGIVTDKPWVDSTVDRMSGPPLVVYAETVVNSLYEADLEDSDRSRTMPCRIIRPNTGNSRGKYGNAGGGLQDGVHNATLPNKFMIYSDFDPETTNPYESLIGTQNTHERH